MLPPRAELLSADRAMLAVSTADFRDLKAKTLPPAVKEMMAKVTGDLDRQMPVFKGVTAFLRMDPRTLSKDLSQQLETLGVTEPMVLAGSVGGVFNGRPSVALYADLPTLPIRSSHRSILRAKPTSAGTKLFLVAEALPGSVNLQLGVEGVVGVRIGNDEIDIGGRAFVLISTISQGVRLAGKMEGTWRNPFGLEGIEFSDLVIGGGVDADSSVELAIGGKAVLGKLQYDLAGVVSVVAASGGLVPKKLGLKFEGSELSQFTQVQIMGAFVKGAIGGTLANAIPPGESQSLLKRIGNADVVGSIEETLPLPYLKYEDVALYIVTPGVTFPELDGLDGMGVGVKGRLSFMNRELGRVDNRLTLRDGLKIDARPGEIDAGVLTLQNAKVDIAVPMPGLRQSDR
jgi:hypothetical protein